MRLVDLSPNWLYKGGQRVGFIFICPTKPDQSQTCFSVAMRMSEQVKVIDENFEEGFYETYAHDIQLCDKNCAWSITGEFENLTVTPSLDGSAGGNWHGFITDGNIIGGL